MTDSAINYQPSAIEVSCDPIGQEIERISRLSPIILAYFLQLPLLYHHIWQAARAQYRSKEVSCIVVHGRF